MGRIRVTIADINLEASIKNMKLNPLELLKDCKSTVSISSELSSASS